LGDALQRVLAQVASLQAAALAYGQLLRVRFGELGDGFDWRSHLLTHKHEGRWALENALDSLHALLLEHDVYEGVLGDEYLAARSANYVAEGTKIVSGEALVVHQEERLGVA